MLRYLAFCLVIFLTACGSEEQELQEWMKQESKDFRGTVPPLPQVKPYEPVAFEQGTMVDPFLPSKINVDAKTQSGGARAPDLNRAREPLEAYPLESLKFVGTLTKNRQNYAIISVDGGLYQIRVGNYAGQEFGVVTKITENEVTLREFVQDSAGDWTERTSTMQLQSKE